MIDSTPLFAVMGVIYLLAFGTACAFIPTRRPRPWLRWVVDVVAALASIPLATLLLQILWPLLASFDPLIIIYTIPCIQGSLFGVIYAYARRSAFEWTPCEPK